jgi:O-antigen/teichoic acid export membrane protein
MKIPSRIQHILWALANRGGGMVLQFASVWVIAKAVGVSGVGVYSFYTSWMTVLAALSGFGSATYTIRTVAVYSKHGNHAAIRHYVKKMAALLLGAGLLTAVLIAGPGRALAAYFVGDAELLDHLVWAAAGSVAFMFLRLMSETLKSMSMLNTSMVLESMLIPALLILLCLWALLTSSTLTVEWLIGAHIAFMMVATVAMFCYVWRGTRPSEAPGSGTRQHAPVLNRSMLPLWGSSLLGMLFLNMPVLLLPSFATTEEMGLFAIAYRFINICVTLLMVVGGIYGPRFAKEYADANGPALKQSLKQTQMFSMVLYAPLFVLFVATPEFVMGLFGEPFRAGGSLLVAMAVGQLVYASTGLVGMMMNMIHREHEEFWITLGATVLMAALVAGFGSQLSVLGVAIGFGVGLGLKNVASWVAVRRYLALIHAPTSPAPSAS